MKGFLGPKDVTRRGSEARGGLGRGLEVGQRLWRWSWGLLERGGFEVWVVLDGVLDGVLGSEHVGCITHSDTKGQRRSPAPCHEPLF